MFWLPPPLFFFFYFEEVVIKSLSVGVIQISVGCFKRENVYFTCKEEVRYIKTEILLKLQDPFKVGNNGLRFQSVFVFFLQAILLNRNINYCD